MFATVLTKRDFSESHCYLSDVDADAHKVARLMLDGNPGQFIRAWVKSVAVTHKQATAWWAKQGRHDGTNGLSCPVVPITFAQVYEKNFQRAQKAGQNR